MGTLTLSVLGPLEVTLDGAAASGFDSNKVRALLIYLAVESGHSHSREKLAGLIWPEKPHSTALSNLRYALSNLRKSIGDRQADPPYLHIDARSIGFNPDSDHSIDIHTFDSLRSTDQIEPVQQALDLYRGDFLEGFSLPDSIAFEEWLLKIRERYRIFAQEGLQQLSNYFERLGRCADAVPYALRLVEQAPWLESGHVQLMRLYASNNQRTAALAQFETCRRALAEELAVEPARETVDLFELIRSSRFQAPPAQPRFLLPDAVDLPISSPAFFSRNAELTHLDAAWKKVMGRQGQAVFVIGEAGSGKTMLVNEFARRLQEQQGDVLVVSGSCSSQSGTGDPYLPFLDCLRMLSGDVEMQWESGRIRHKHAMRLWENLPQFTEVLMQEGPALLDRFFPGSQLLDRARIGAPQMVSQISTMLEEASQYPPNLTQTDLFEQYTRVLQRLAVRMPLILLLDDLQWLDNASQGLLFHLCRRLSGYRILLLCASRPEGIDMQVGTREIGPIAQIFNETRQQNGDVLIDLSQADGRQFIHAMVDSEPNRLGEDFQAQLHRHTLGHPLYATELLNGMRSRGEIKKDVDGIWEIAGELNWSVLPARVEAAISTRVRQLPQHLAGLMATASLEGEHFTAEVIAGVNDLPADEVVAQLSGPLSRDFDLVHAEGIEHVNGSILSRYRFRHNLFQGYFAALHDPVERGRLHGRIGENLEQLYGSDRADRAGQLAYHFEAANVLDKAVKYLAEASDHAVRLLAHNEAIANYERALSLLGKLPESMERHATELSIRRRLGAPLLAVYGFGADSLAQNYERARSLTHFIDNPVEKFMVINGLKGFYDLRADFQTALELANELLQISKNLDDIKLKTLALHDYCCTALYMGDYKEFAVGRAKAHSLYDRDLFKDMVHETAFDPEIAGLAHEGWGMYYLGYYDKAIARAAESVALADSLGHPFMIAFANMFAANLHYLLRDHENAQRYAENGAALSDQSVGFFGVGSQFLAVWSGSADLCTESDLEKAQRFFEMQRAMGAEMGYVSFFAPLAEMMAQVGKREEGIRLIEEGIRLVKQTGFRQVEAGFYTTHGELLQSISDFDGAETAYQEALSLASQLGALGDQVRPATKLAGLKYINGQAKAAYHLLHEVYNQFTEGFDAPAMLEARTLLETLSETLVVKPSHSQ